jgi:hypothetical protein
MDNPSSNNKKTIDLSAHASAFNLENAYVFAKNHQDRPHIDGDIVVYDNGLWAKFVESTRESARRAKEPKEPEDTEGNVWKSTGLKLLDQKAFLKSLEKFQDPDGVNLGFLNRLKALTQWGEKNGVVYSAAAYIVSSGDGPEDQTYDEYDSLQEAMDAASVQGPVDPEDLGSSGIEKCRKWLAVDGPQFPQENTEDYLVKQWAKANGFDGVWTGADEIRSGRGVIFSEAAQKAKWSPYVSAPAFHCSHPALSKGLSEQIESRRNDGLSVGPDFLDRLEQESKSSKLSPGAV